MDTTNYMTNTSEVDLTDDEMIKKNAQLTKDNEAYQQEEEGKRNKRTSKKIRCFADRI